MSSTVPRTYEVHPPRFPPRRRVPANPAAAKQLDGPHRKAMYDPKTNARRREQLTKWSANSKLRMLSLHLFSCVTSKVWSRQPCCLYQVIGTGCLRETPAAIPIGKMWRADVAPTGTSTLHHKLRGASFEKRNRKKILLLPFGIISMLTCSVNNTLRLQNTVWVSRYYGKPASMTRDHCQPFRLVDWK